MSAKFSGPTRNWNCLIASMKGADSMSPTVPPSLNKYQTMRIECDSGWRYLNDADIRFLARLIDGDF